MRQFFLTILLLISAAICHAQKLTPYLPDPAVANGTAVIVCPGGSYHWLSPKIEGSDVAEKLCAEGFAAYVLEYCHAGVGYFLFGPLSPVQNHYREILADVSSALRSVTGYQKVGIMGFSAGGHLSLISGEGLVPDAPRPDFVVALYPVVTFSDKEYVHKRSRRGFLGMRSGNKELRQLYSAELSVPDDMPPVFLANCMDDKTVNWRNCALMDNALTAKNIDHVYEQYAEGGHGFGSGSETADWFPAFLEWYKEL